MKRIPLRLLTFWLALVQSSFSEGLLLARAGDFGIGGGLSSVGVRFQIVWAFIWMRDGLKNSQVQIRIPQ